MSYDKCMNHLRHLYYETINLSYENLESMYDIIDLENILNPKIFIDYFCTHFADNFVSMPPNEFIVKLSSSVSNSKHFILVRRIQKTNLWQIDIYDEFFKTIVGNKPMATVVFENIFYHSEHMKRKDKFSSYLMKKAFDIGYFDYIILLNTNGSIQDSYDFDDNLGMREIFSNYASIVVSVLYSISKKKPKNSKKCIGIFPKKANLLHNKMRISTQENCYGFAHAVILNKSKYKYF